MAAYSRIESWNSDRGFGFVRVDGKRVFIHTTVIKPQPKRGSDLTGVELAEIQVNWKGEKGPAVVSAVTRDEFEKRQAEKTQQAAEEATRQQKKIADKDLLGAKLPELRAQIEKILPVPQTWRIDFEDGFTAHLVNRYVSEASLDPERGAGFVCQFSVRVSYGEASEDIRFEPKTFVVGWAPAYIKMAESPYYHIVDREASMLRVKFYVENKEFSLPFPAIVQEPVRRGNKVVQRVSAQTPLGEAFAELRIYENPDTRLPANQFDAVIGDFDVSPLIAEIDTEVLQKMGIIGEMPKVEFQVATYFETYQVGGKWESPDGYIAGDDSHDASISRGGVVLTIWSRFLDQQGNAGISLRVQGLDRAGIEEAVKATIDLAIKNRNLTNDSGKAYGQKLLAHVMSFVPAFQTMEGLVALEEDYETNRRLKGTARGFTVVAAEQELDHYLRDEKPTKVVQVISEPVAKKLGLAYKKLSGPTIVYWLSGQ